MWSVMIIKCHKEHSIFEQILYKTLFSNVFKIKSFVTILNQFIHFLVNIYVGKAIVAGILASICKYMYLEKHLLELWYIFEKSL